MQAAYAQRRLVIRHATKISKRCARVGVRVRFRDRVIRHATKIRKRCRVAHEHP